MYAIALFATIVSAMASGVSSSGPGRFHAMRREVLDDSRSEEAPTHHQSKRRHRNHVNQKGKSLLQLQQRQTTSLFPLYPRSESYEHPLDAHGQKQEKDAVAMLTPKEVMNYLQELIEFPSRSYTNLQQSQRVEHFLKADLEFSGFTACLHNFTSGDNQLTNVIAHVPGTTADTVTIGAHYDSRPFDGSAPGAEDNGSGVAALMMIAKAFAALKIKPKASIYFVAFAGEEPGLLGSNAFAKALVKNSEGIPAECKSPSSFLRMRQSATKGTQDFHRAIIMDEVGWASPSLEHMTVNLESMDWTKDVMDHLRESSQMHNGDDLQVVHSNHPFGSDHMSFLDRQMKAVLTINGDDEAYPNYHQSSDTIDHVSGKLLSMIAKMNMGALLRMAGTQPA